MLAAERLFAKQGIANVSVRSIVLEAGQKNESALQYHFGNRDGLIAALHEKRNHQIQEERAKILIELQAVDDDLSVRNVAYLMVRPTFQLAARDRGFRDYITVFAHLVLFSSQRLTTLLARYEDTGVDEIKAHLKGLVPPINEALFAVRFENTVRFATLSMSRHAREKGAFQGPSAEFFFNNLVDTIAAMLAAEPSPETLAIVPD